MNMIYRLEVATTRRSITKTLDDAATRWYVIGDCQTDRLSPSQLTLYLTVVARRRHVSVPPPRGARWGTSAANAQEWVFVCSTSSYWSNCSSTFLFDGVLLILFFSLFLFFIFFLVCPVFLVILYFFLVMFFLVLVLFFFFCFVFFMLFWLIFYTLLNEHK